MYDSNAAEQSSDQLLAKKKQLAALVTLLKLTVTTALLPGDSFTCRCELSHEWDDTIENLDKRGGCPSCLKSRELTRSHYFRLAREKGLTFWGSIPRTRRELGTWVCKREHISKASWSQVIDWTNCPTCNDHVPKIEADYHELAAICELSWTGSLVPENTGIKTSWVCLAKGHLFLDSYQVVQGRKVGCRKCNRKRAKEKEDYLQLALAKNLIWTATSPPSRTDHETTWKCNAVAPHEFRSSFANVQKGPGCVDCSGYKRRVESDYIALGVRLKLTYLGPLPAKVEEPTSWRCEKGHVSPRSYNSLRHSPGCALCRKTSREDYREVGRSRGITWVGIRLPKNNRTRTWWQHDSCGHRWKAWYSNIQQGTGCPKCARKLTAQDCHALAASKDCVWLGTDSVLPNNKVKTPWKCLREGHDFDASYDRFKRSTGCRVCFRLYHGRKPET